MTFLELVRTTKSIFLLIIDVCSFSSGHQSVAQWLCWVPVWTQKRTFPFLPLPLWIVNFVSVRLLSSTLWRCRRSSAHWHKSDPRAAVGDCLSSVDKHLRFISAVWRENAGLQLPGAPLFSPPRLLSVVRFFASPPSAPDDFWSSTHRSRRRQQKKTNLVYLLLNCQNCGEFKCVFCCMASWTLCSWEGVSLKHGFPHCTSDLSPLGFVAASMQVFRVTPVSKRWRSEGARQNSTSRLATGHETARSQLVLCSRQY